MDPHQLKLAFWNVNGLRTRMNVVRELTQKHKIDVIAVCGTRLGTNYDGRDFEIEDFQMERHEREPGRGGVALYIRNGLDFVRMPAYENRVIDIIWVQCNVEKRKPILVGCCYRPSRARNDYLREICTLTRDVTQEICEKDIFLMGTFNIDWNQNSQQKKQLAAAAEESELRQITGGENTYDDGEGRCNDHIYTNVPNDRLDYNQLNPRQENRNKCHIVTVTVE